MIRHGEPPYLECSSKGDKRFSAFFARLKSWNNMSIEEIFQAAKKFEDGSTGLSIKEAKGRRPVNEEEVAELYFNLWVEYLKENPHLVPVILEASGLSDIFGKPGHNCQATVLWQIRQMYLEELAAK